jgi:hypothetical protein
MIPFRLWYYLGRCALLLFVGFLAPLFFPENPVAIGIGLGALAILIFTGIFGAYLGLKLCRGPLLMRCPFCGGAGQVGFSKVIGMHLDCPRCGSVRGHGFLKAQLAHGPLTHSEQEEEEARPGGLPLRDLVRTSPWPVVAILVIPAASVVAASLIHRFSWFYLLIPGLGCLLVGTMQWQSLQTGVIEDNTGRVMRRHHPFRFWCKFAIWTVAYLFAASFPLFYALQESAAGR